MKTWLHIPTKQRYPAHGMGAAFEFKNGVLHKAFITGKGWHKVKAKDWLSEEIPDLKIAEVHPPNLSREDRQKFREYAAQYGVEVAKEFMWTCDLMKATEAKHILNPKLTEDQEIWFEQTFGCSPYHFRHSLPAVLGYYSLDVIAFEKYLQERGYVPSDLMPQSISQFVDLKWGKDTAAKLKTFF